MSAHALLNLLNPLEKRIRCIHYLYHNICRSVNTNTNDRQTDGLNNLGRGPQEKLHTKYQRPRPFSFKQKDFKVLPI